MVTAVQIALGDGFSVQLVSIFEPTRGGFDNLKCFVLSFNKAKTVIARTFFLLGVTS